MRAIVSVSRTRARRRCVTIFRSLSPAGCPSVSFTVLKWSRSSRWTATHLAAPDARQRMLEPLVQQHAVGQVGQRVVQRHVHDLGLGAATVRGVHVASSRSRRPRGARRALRSRSRPGARARRHERCAPRAKAMRLATCSSTSPLPYSPRSALKRKTLSSEGGPSANSRSGRSRSFLALSLARTTLRSPSRNVMPAREVVDDGLQAGGSARSTACDSARARAVSFWRSVMSWCVKTRQPFAISRGVTWMTRPLAERMHFGFDFPEVGEQIVRQPLRLGDRHSSRWRRDAARSRARWFRAAPARASSRTCRRRACCRRRAAARRRTWPGPATCCSWPRRAAYSAARAALSFWRSVMSSCVETQPPPRIGWRADGDGRGRR